MKVSIVTPSYNQGPFLDQTIRSVLGQDYPEIEYIVVDGGSTDESVDVIRGYADRLAWWVSEKDAGQADALRKGFARATGDVFAWLNSDDLFAPGAVREAVALLKANPGAGLVYGNAASIDASGRLLNDMVFRQYGREELAAFNIICQPAVFMRRDAYLEAGGIDLAYHFLLDHHLWLRIAANRSISFSTSIWAFARQHASAKNVAQAEKFGAEAYRIVAWMQSDPYYSQILDGKLHLIQAAALRFDARYLLDGGLALKALLTYLRALRTHPPTAIQEWPRIVFAGLSVVGLKKMGNIYYRRKHRRGSGLMPEVKNITALYE